MMQVMDSPLIFIKPDEERADRTQRIYYELRFRIGFLESKADGFQHFFEKLMLKAHPKDFIPCRPWGKVGDRKNDGYLSSERTLFQVYAPNEMNARDVIKKINEDFDGAKSHWKEYFNKWVFVHNTQDERLPPHIIEEIIKLQSTHPEIKIEPWGYEALLRKFRQLYLEDLESWFGPPLTIQEITNLGYRDLQNVLYHIISSPTHKTSKVRNVSQGKIEANLLSESVAKFLKLGMQKSPFVAQFFNNWHDPLYGEQIAAAFKKKYREIRDSTPSLHPDEIFGRLEAWAGGIHNTNPNHKAAVLAVLAYFFDKCEIFEDAQFRSPI